MELTTAKYTVRINYRTGEIKVIIRKTGEIKIFSWNQLAADFLSSATTDDSVDFVIEDYLLIN